MRIERTRRVFARSKSRLGGTGILMILCAVSFVVAAMVWAGALNPTKASPPYPAVVWSSQQQHPYSAGLALGMSEGQISALHPAAAGAAGRAGPIAFRTKGAIQRVWFADGREGRAVWRIRTDRVVEGQSMDAVLGVFGQHFGFPVFVDCDRAVTVEVRRCHLRFTGRNASVLDVYASTLDAGERRLQVSVVATDLNAELRLASRI